MVKQIIIAVACTLGIAIIIVVGVFLNSLQKTAPHLTQTEIIVLFKKNTNVFEDVAKSFLNDPNIIGVSADQSDITNDGKSYKVLNGNIIVRSKQTLSNGEIRRLEESNISVILTQFKFWKVISDYNGVYFVEGANMQMSHGILYTEDDNDPYLIKKERIKGNWYYFESR